MTEDNTTVSDNSSINRSHHLMVRIQDFHSWHTSSILVESTNNVQLNNVLLGQYSEAAFDKRVIGGANPSIDKLASINVEHFASIAQLVRAPDC